MAKTKTTRKAVNKAAAAGRKTRTRGAKAAGKTRVSRRKAGTMASNKVKPAAGKVVKKTLAVPGKGKRYSSAQQKSILDKYHALRAGGQDAQAAARSVGVSYLTLRKWEKNAGIKPMGRKKTGGAGRGATGRDARKGPSGKKTRSGHLVLITPDGHRIEGINPNDLRDVLKALK